mmetsp:Transcript_25481/g.37640  ORF Transcript_25481/g.37640 Transcript_25481/m.37640 type:complete len:345 (+) Transcript_25481:192-1226(+)|eukprot:CAMPEP_0194229016 /NCGR_PEP_ID=MMETSP0156-20130528/43675_1 /TAXON_ID=33649 /ORGANISM="Thalassionema nitzschioides, Strain L26-B" /LENGTH=344 /DNA_ID=CAMNT_0038961551 /DNA_START=80 /DNA_END=1114 /DNA_ORIENTATION=-
MVSSSALLNWMLLTFIGRGCNGFTTCHSGRGNYKRCEVSNSVKNLRSSPHDDDDGISVNRRHFINSIAFSSIIAAGSISSPSNAFEKAYPVELGFVDGDTSRDLQAIRKERILEKKESYKKSMDYVKDTNPLSFRGPKDILTCGIWGSALWLLGGSRSNPLVTPIANVIYNDEEEQWLKDRNDGLFASLPLPLNGLLLVVFLALGILTDRLVLLLADGSANVSLQYAVLGLLNGFFFELGRVASGEKVPTRDQFDRTSELREEFNEFASNRLKRGGNCHRSDVVRAFRRYFAKYRREDSEQYPLSNMEIEELLREWNSVNTLAEITSTGFYNGLSINEQADAFR